MLAEFSCPAGRRRFFYGEHLERMKRRSSASDGSGLSDCDSECPSVCPAVPLQRSGAGGTLQSGCETSASPSEGGRDRERELARL